MITAGAYPLEAEVIGVEQESPSIVTLTLCLTDTEAAVDWNEAQLDQIERMGIENYLAQQVKGDPA